VNPELSVVLPVRNQADHIAGVIGRFQKEFLGRSWEILLVPNACSDDSPRLCRELAEKDGGIRVVENPAGGWGLSVRTGLEAARGRFLCYANSARTDPATIPALFDLLKERPESLAKVRRHSRGQLLREFGSLLYNLECRLLFGLSCRDVNGTPKIFAAGLLSRMKLTSEGDLLDAEILAQCRRLGVPVLEMPLAGFTRHGGKSTTNPKSAARMYWGALRLRMGMR
jgi:glycosyltransferase involved in cell wall biosynthesis